jgi:phosphate:Na+ symporter
VRTARPVLAGVDLGHAAAAIDAIAKEQPSIAESLPAYLDEIRDETRGTPGPTARARHTAAVASLKDLDSATRQVTAGRGGDAARSRDLAHLAERTELLRALSDGICELAETIGRVGPSGPLSTLTGHMAEALHAVLLTATDAIATPDEANLSLLHDLTADRGQIMESIRRSLVRGERTLTIDDHQLLFTTTSLFERIVRLLRRLQSAMAAHARD